MAASRLRMRTGMVGGRAARRRSSNAASRSGHQRLRNAFSRRGRRNPHERRSVTARAIERDREAGRGEEQRERLSESIDCVLVDAELDYERAADRALEVDAEEQTPAHVSLRRVEQ